MINLTKIDFNGDELIIQYSQSGDQDKSIHNRMVMVNWKKNEELKSLLTKMFSILVENYLSAETLEIDWSKFMEDLKKYEVKKNDHK